MGWIRYVLYWVALRIALRRPAPNRIPRTPPASNGVNCYTAYLGDQEDPLRFVAQSMDKHQVSGLWFGNGYGQGGYQASIPLSQITSFAFRANHYLGHYDFRYFSAWSLIWKELTLYPRRWIIKERIGQFFFNRRALTRHERMNVLTLVYDQTIADSQFWVDASRLMNLLYSVRWVEHPDHHNLYAYCNLVLESLRQSDDLSFGNNQYRLSPHALETLSKYEHANTQHRDNHSIQRTIAVLTLVLAIIGAAQITPSHWWTWLGSWVEAWIPYPSSEPVYPISPPPFD